MLNTTVLFIGEAALKQESVISENVDPKLLIPTIKEVQNIYILPLLGTALYNELVTQVSGNSVTPDNTTLLQSYVQPTMIKYCVYESMLDLSFKFQNKNVATKSSEFSQQASLNDIRYLMDKAINRAQYYAERVTLFLMANNMKYPSYLNQGNADISTIYPTAKNYSNGMYLGGDIDCDDIPARIKYQGNNPRRWML
jgi:hypothetical protein